MRLIYLFLISILALCAPILVCGQSKKTKTKPKVVEKSTICKSNELTFPCPKGFKIIISGENDGLFLAKNLDKYDNYGLFVVSVKDGFDKEKLVTNIKDVALKTLYPKESLNYQWKEIDFINTKNLSKFEIGKTISLGFNENNLVTFAYRHISINDKQFIIGSISSREEKGEEAKELFDIIAGGQSAGCFEESRIIYSVTGEKESKTNSPCAIEVNTTNKTTVSN